MRISEMRVMFFRRIILICVATLLLGSTVKAQENMFANTGLKDKEVQDFFLRLQRDVKNNDATDLSKSVSYPLKVFLGNKHLKIRTEKDFVAQYNKIFTADVRSAILCEKYETLFHNYSGVALARGTVWFSGVIEPPDSEYTIKIIAINDSEYTKMFVQACNEAKSEAGN